MQVLHCNIKDYLGEPVGLSDARHCQINHPERLRLVMQGEVAVVVVAARARTAPEAMRRSSTAVWRAGHQSH
jgi:hypothetical protein